MSKALHVAVEALMDPTKVRVWREDTHVTEYHGIPSLWYQLSMSSAWGGGDAGTSAFGSRPVISTSTVALVIEICAAIDYAATRIGRVITFPVNHLHCSCRTPMEPCKGFVTENVRDRSAELRAIAAAVLDDPDQQVQWTEMVRGWVTRATQALGLNPPRPQWARGTPCPSCEATTAHAMQDGEDVRTPALAITWIGPDDDKEYHSDAEWRVRAVDCRACGVAYWRGDGLEWLTNHLLNKEATT